MRDLRDRSRRGGTWGNRWLRSMRSSVAVISRAHSVLAYTHTHTHTCMYARKFMYMCMEEEEEATRCGAELWLSACINTYIGRCACAYMYLETVIFIVYRCKRAYIQSLV